MNGHQATLNDDPMNKSKEFNNGNAKVLNWNSTVQNWNECAEEMRRNSGTSSGEESPPSDIPASSSISNTPNVFEAFLSAIDKNEIVERPDLETQLKIMSWLCGVDESRMAIDKNEIVERPDLETQLKIMSWLCGVDESRMLVMRAISPIVARNTGMWHSSFGAVCEK
ncbi:hypothetical protein Tcan_03321 [Toxocara canis]|uniref:Uncharacterized protein n=1 Tax=Toxocara canis TaxID=6265 RepID=A0A0B2VRR6_TOXCA|nr:hypothetical protein Tcan_03321 [Toxocara canis]